ncbi:MAG TPA: PAS domain S-box protein [Nitrospira sp.]|nr:PAS domain S-box protein [Nitrospira sp.]
MALPPLNRMSTSQEAEERELEPGPVSTGPADGTPNNGVVDLSEHQNLVALKEETRRRLEVESTLQDSEARYRLLYDNNPTMYFTLSPDGTVVSVNQFGATQLGYQPDELIGQSVLKVFKPEDHAAVLEQLTVCAASPLKVFQWEIRKVRKDGSTLWVKERAQTVIDHTGQILSLVVCEDITERRLTEDYIRESEERWRALFEHAGVGIAQLSLNGQFLRVNPRLCETLGYSSKTMLRRTCQEFVHPDDLRVTQARLGELFAGKCPSFSLETRWHRCDDVWVWIDLTVSLVRNATSAPAYFIAVIQNIGDRKKAEEALQKSETRFRQIAETIEEVVWSADPAIGKTLYISPAYERVWGRTCDSLYKDPESFIDSIHPDDRARVLAVLAEHPKGLPFAHEYRLVRPDGTVRWVWDRGFPIRDPNTGRLTHYVGVALDITERRQAEEALRTSESAIRELHEITSRIAAPFDQQMRELLDLGRRRFQLPIAAFTTLKRDRLELTVIRSDRPMPDEGTLLPQCDICTQTLEMSSPVALEHLGHSDWKDGSACFLLGFKSYLGTSLSVGGQKFGTICFMDYEPYRGHFSEADKDFLLLMARWITRDLERRNSERTLQEQEEALRASEERFSKAFRSSPYPIGITDLETGVCLDINDAALATFGYTREEIIGQTTSILGIWPHPEARQQFIELLKRKGSVRNLEVPLRSKRGDVRRFLASTEVIVLKGKECLVTIGTDITEQKRAEEALRRSELAVRQAFEERECLSQDLHDNLLQSLYAVGMGLELTKQRLQRISRTNAKRLEQSVSQLNNVIREVRTFISHVQPPVVLDEQTVTDALRALAGSFMATGAGEIVVTVDDEVGLRLSSEQRTHLLAIAKEALSNSIRHTKADKRMVTLRRQGNKIRLEVIDNGHGFSPGHRRAQGMGLQNMRARARKLRGRIAITSVLTQGTTVTLTIPST